MDTLERTARVPDEIPRPGDPGYLPPKPVAVPQYELITPELAAQYLERMHANRTVSKIEKGVMSQLLQDGEFYGAISPVFFDDQGVPASGDGAQDPWDGQHRFEAIVETDTPAWLLVVRGVTETESEFIDTGRRRMYSDNLKIAGAQDYNRQSVLARQMALYTLHGIDAVRHPNQFPVTRPQMDKWVGAPGMIEAIHFGVALYKYAGLSESQGAYAVLRTAQVDAREPDGIPSKVTVDPTGFWRAVRDGDGLERGDPAKTLREWGMRKRLGQAPADKRLLTHYVLATAYNKHVTGQPYSKVQPKFEQRSNGKAYFPARNVPDYITFGEASPLDGARNAYAALKRAR
jgi:hypothetical protein